MKLYVNKDGEWCGTQVEAKKVGASVTEVPTDKQGLLDFLNGQQQLQPPTPTSPSTTMTNGLSKSVSQTLFEVADVATLDELQHVVYRYLMKVDDALGLKRNT